jgi:hypothetical protein
MAANEPLVSLEYREKDPLDSSESYKSLAETNFLIFNPLQGPICLLLYTRDSVNRIEKELSLLGVTDISINEQRVHLAMDVFDHDLEACINRQYRRNSELRRFELRWRTARPSFHSQFHLDQEYVPEAAKNASTREIKYLYKPSTPFIVIQFLPVAQIFAQVDFFDCPEGSFVSVRYPLLSCTFAILAGTRWGTRPTVRRLNLH